MLTTIPRRGNSIPPSEMRRLAETLQPYLREAGVRKQDRTPSKRFELVERVLAKQKGTCCFAGGDSSHCWNHNKDYGPSYLKLEWSHFMPKAQRGDSRPSNLILLCARCNNHLQSSRTVPQLVAELEHKLPVVKR